MPSIESQRSDPAEVGFVFSKLKNIVAAHKNSADAPPGALQSDPTPP
jgi:hypothetical protein